MIWCSNILLTAEAAFWRNCKATEEPKAVLSAREITLCPDQIPAKVMALCLQLQQAVIFVMETTFSAVNWSSPFLLLSGIVGIVI